MRDIDHRRIRHRLFQLRNLDPCGHPQSRIKVRERFVKQIDLGVAHDRAANRHPLALPARQRLWQAVKIGFQLQDLGGLGHGGLDFSRGFLGDFQRKAHVVAHRHMRIKRIGLKHHRNAALRRWYVIHPRAINAEIATRDLFQSRNHPQKRGFAAARGADKNDQFPGFDVQIDIGQNLDLAIRFFDIAQR